MKVGFKARELVSDVLPLAQFAGPATVVQQAGNMGELILLAIQGYLLIANLSHSVVTDLETYGLQGLGETAYPMISRNQIWPIVTGERVGIPISVAFTDGPSDAVVFAGLLASHFELSVSETWEVERQ